nr:hypothetical protein Itr_chr07CG10530 [Ipomoea trifida]
MVDNGQNNEELRCLFGEAEEKIPNDAEKSVIPLTSGRITEDHGHVEEHRRERDEQCCITIVP